MNKSISKFPLGYVHEFPERLGKTVRIGDKEVAVFKLSNGIFRAVENRCPHRGGVLSQGIVCGEFVFCPMHDWKICLHDGKVQKPDIGCVKSYQTIIEGEDVFLLIDEE